MKLSIDWLEVPMGPQAILEFLSCSCKRDCLTSCQCVANNLTCTELCDKKRCINQNDVGPVEKLANSSDDDDSDDERI